MQPKVGGRETTFRYRGPFTMSSGKRTLKVIAVSRYDSFEHCLYLSWRAPIIVGNDEVN